MPIVETLAPLILLIGLGAALARMRFLGTQFMADMNKLAFWVALPALFFVSATHTTAPGRQTWLLLAILLGGTVLISVIAWLLSISLGLAFESRGTLVQAAFRGNLAYIATPLLAYSFSINPVGDETTAMAATVLVIVLIMVFYNILAVLVLHPTDGGQGRMDWLKVGRVIITNPLVVAGILGLSVAFFGIPLPRYFVHALDVLGGAAVPLSLLCIGGSLATTSVHGRRFWITTGALLKVMVLPLLVLALSRLCGLGLMEERIALVVAACPTAAAAYVMASQMGGDKALASGTIAASTLLSAISLAAALWISS